MKVIRGIPADPFDVRSDMGASSRLATKWRCFVWSVIGLMVSIWAAVLWEIGRECYYRVMAWLL